MRILITGGLGFIGSHLAASLRADGHQLIILDDLSTGKREHAVPGAEIVIADAAGPSVFDSLLDKVDACFHLAAVASVALSHVEWMRTHQVNVGAFVNLMAAIAKRKKPIPVVYASSAAVYGDNAVMPLGEESATSPTSAYGADKLACELQGRVGWMIHKIPNIGLRFFNVYGPRQDPASPYSGVISIFAARLMRGEKPIIHGDGLQSRDFIYVGDVVQSLRLAMDALVSGALHDGYFNICTGHATTLLELIKAMGNAAGKSPVIEHGEPRAGDIRESLGNPNRAAELLKFRASMKLEAGLRETLDWLSGA